MTLEDDVEPVCVEGIETEAAMERLRDLNHISKGQYWGHIIAERKAPALIFGIGCFLISFWNPLSVSLGVVEIAGFAYCDWRLRKEQEMAVKFLEANYRQ